MATNIYLTDTLPVRLPTVWKPGQLDAACIPPVADFTVSLTTVEEDVVVQFTDTSTGNPMFAWAWDFGDGNTSAEQNPTHTYADAGTYTVTLAATNACGVDFEIKVDYVIVTVCVPPVASFTTDVSTGEVPFTVTATDTSTGSGTLVYDWDFGDGFTSTDASPSHEYTVAGSYSITLTVTNGCGSDAATPIAITADTPSTSPIYDFVAVAFDGSNGQRAMRSDLNGENWSSASSIPVTDGGWKSICYSPLLDMYVAVALNSNSGSVPQIMISTNGGATFSTQTAPGTSTTLRFTSVIWAPAPANKFVAVSYGTTSTGGGTADRVITSTDGVNWTQQTLPTQSGSFQARWNDLCYSPSLDLFVVVASFSPDGNTIMTSPDAVTWTMRAGPNSTTVTWSEPLGLFCLISGSDAYTSPDGVTWTSHAAVAPGALNWNDIIWVDDISKFVAVAPLTCMTSPDGTTWTSRTIPAFYWYSIAWNGTTLCAVASVQSAGSAADQVVISPDGINWTAKSADTFKTWFGVAAGLVP